MIHFNKQLGLVVLVTAFVPTLPALAQNNIIPMQAPMQMMPNPNLSPSNISTPPGSYPTPSNSQITDSVTQTQRNTTREHIKTQTPPAPSATPAPMPKK